MRQERPPTARLTVLTGLLLVLLATGLATGPQTVLISQSLIVQGGDLDAMAALVEELGGIVSHRLPIISAIGANLTGEGVAVAALDTGLWNKGPLIDHPDGFRVLAQYDVQQS